LALLQAEASVCGSELANVPNERWHLGLCFLSYSALSVFLAWHTTVSIRIVADCVALPCQVTRMLKRAATLEFTTVSAIIFIHC